MSEPKITAGQCAMSGQDNPFVQFTYVIYAKYHYNIAVLNSKNKYTVWVVLFCVFVNAV